MCFTCDWPNCIRIYLIFRSFGCKTVGGYHHMSDEHSPYLCCRKNCYRFQNGLPLGNFGCCVCELLLVLCCKWSCIFMHSFHREKSTVPCVAIVPVLIGSCFFDLSTAMCFCRETSLLVVCGSPCRYTASVYIWTNIPCICLSFH